MEITRGDIQLQITPFTPFLTPKIIEVLNPCKTLDPKILQLANGSYAPFLAQTTNPLQFIQSLTLYVALVTLVNKLIQRSPKPLMQLFVKGIILNIISCTPAIMVKLALYAIRRDAQINMHDRKERTLYIISSIALCALMTPHFLKIHRKAYSFCPKGVTQYALIQMAVHLVVVEIFDWNDQKIAEEIELLPPEELKSFIKYRTIGPATKRVVDEKLDAAERQINEALAERAEWQVWMNTAPIREDQITLPSEPNAEFATFFQNHPKVMSLFTIPNQIEWNKVFIRAGKALVFPIPLTDEHLPFIIDGENLLLFHTYFRNTPFFFLLSETKRETVNQQFAPQAERESALEDIDGRQEEPLLRASLTPPQSKEWTSLNSRWNFNINFILTKPNTFLKSTSGFRYRF